MDKCDAPAGAYYPHNATLATPPTRALPRAFTIDAFPGKWREHRPLIREASSAGALRTMPSVAVRQTADAIACAAPLRAPLFVVGAMWLRNWFHLLRDFGVQRLIQLPRRCELCGERTHEHVSLPHDRVAMLSESTYKFVSDSRVTTE